mmetsp:Transcript_24062/g.80868  ORF Transcript_24062/g.80868 Transcript_24062/m.80868 type:complete len:748 (-) Transcript_24062:672-2915(-)
MSTVPVAPSQDDADNGNSSQLPPDIVLVVTRLDPEAAKDDKERREMEQTRAERQELYTKLRNLGLELTVRKGDASSDTFKDKTFILISARDDVLDSTASSFAIEKRLKEEHKDPNVPEEDFTGYAEYSTQTRHLFAEGFDGFFTSLERQRLIFTMLERHGPNHVDLDRVVKDDVIDDYFPMPSAKFADLLEDTWLNAPVWQRAPIHKIRDYFGEKVAFYFAWMHIYTIWLGILAVISVGFGIYQAATSVDNLAVGIYAAILAVWCTAFSEAWKRRQNVLAFLWNVQDFEEEEPPRPEFIQKFVGSKRAAKAKEESGDSLSGKFKRHAKLARLFDEKRGVWSTRGFVETQDGDEHIVFTRAEYIKRTVIGFIGTLLMVVAAVVGTLGIMAAKVFISREHYPRAGPFIGALMNAVFISLMNIFWSFVAVRLNEWETHRTDTQFEDALIFKTFAFQFVNSYVSLFYIAFVQASRIQLFGLTDADGEPIRDQCATDNCLNALFVQLLIILTLKQLVRFALALVPALFGRLKQCYTTRDKPLSRGLRERIQAQAILPTFKGTLSEFSEMAIQYGYLTLFGVAFPWGALVCFAINLVERKADAAKVLKLTRRPRYRGAEDIGTWQAIIEFIGNAAVVTNALVLYFTSPVSTEYLRARFGSEANAFFFLIVCEHVIFAVKLTVAYLTPDVPFWVEAAKTRYTVFIHNKRAEAEGTADLRANYVAEAFAAGGGNDEEARAGAVTPRPELDESQDS